MMKLVQFPKKILNNKYCIGTNNLTSFYKELDKIKAIFKIDVPKNNRQISLLGRSSCRSKINFKQVEFLKRQNLNLQDSN